MKKPILIRITETREKNIYELIDIGGKDDFGMYERYLTLYVTSPKIINLIDRMAQSHIEAILNMRSQFEFIRELAKILIKYPQIQLIQKRNEFRIQTNHNGPIYFVDSKGNGV